MKRSFSSWFRAILYSILVYSCAVSASVADEVLTFHFFGGTLGSNWSGFPDKLAPNIAGTPTSYEELSVTLPVKLVYENYNDFTVGPISGGPIPITDLWFWDDHWDEVQFRVYHSDDFDDDFQECGDDFYLGLSLNEDGELTVANELFGGVGSNTRIEMRWCFESLCSCACGDEVVVAVQWDRPATYYDEVATANVDAYPGTIVVVEEAIVAGGDGHSLFNLFLPQMTVEWVSTDARGASPGYVDASDTAALAQHYGNSVVWGFASDGGRDSLTFHVNFAPWGSSATALDSGDASALAADLETSCGSSKAGDDGHAAAILDWFGFAATGNTIHVNGRDIPEYDLVDNQKRLNALSDPDGYLDHLTSSAENVSWSVMKSVFK